MPAWTGSFGKSGSPSLRITIAGVFRDSRQEFDAVLDTGFTGFIAMPLIQAFPLGLILFGTTTVVLADGSTSYRLTAFCTASVGEHEEPGVVILEPVSTQVLIGMDFLKRFKKGLVVSPGLGLVALVDEAAMTERLREPPEEPGATDEPASS